MNIQARQNLSLKRYKIDLYLIFGIA